MQINNDIYYQKYLKYKMKYLNLKNIEGGAALVEESNIPPAKQISRSNSNVSIESNSDESNYDSEDYQYDSGEESDYEYQEDNGYEGSYQYKEDVINYCKQLAEIEARKNTIIQINKEATQKIIEAKKYIESSNSELVENRMKIPQLNLDQESLEVNIGALENENDKELFMNRLIRVKQDIAFSEGLIKDIENGQQIKNKEIEDNTELIQDNNIKLVDLENEYESQFNQCEIELKEMLALGEKLQDYLGDIRKYKKLNFKEISILNNAVRRVQDPERKEVYTTLLNNIKQLSR